VTQYRLASTSMFYVPGLILWILALRRGNVKGARTDKAARVHFIKVSWPTLPDTAVEYPPVSPRLRRFTGGTLPPPVE